MKYTASQIIDRAKNLADIQNTDFLTHEEDTRYINDAWFTVFNWIINKGDNQFIRTVNLVNSYNGNGFVEYQLPHDLFIIKSLRNPYNGTLIHRHTETEGISSNSYEVVNDKLRLYGAGGNLELTYYLSPLFITFPDETKDLELTNDILDSVKNTVLLSNGNIYNVLTQTNIGTIEIDETLTYKLGNGHIVTLDEDNNLTYVSFNGDTLYTKSEITGTVSFLKDKDGNVLYQILEDSEYSNAYFMSRTVVETNVKLLSTDAYYDESTNRLYVGDTWTVLEYIPSVFRSAPNWDNEPSFYVLSSDQELYRYVVHSYADESVIEEIKLDLPIGIVLAILEYGPIISNGTYATLYSGIPDTDFNFPNELYLSLLACDLALRYAMKMNANTDGLNNLYQNMQSTFMNSLSQDADYTMMPI